ncbi:MAG: hemerythrin domain-containing protein [candidate division NC10 bacterium]|nr:hemerythrin domain-containing protein [candidate division NC10 bacterium]MBI4412736.1 hemerythrin domain-containing protein [candidate division NC10 bacterium]
MKFKIPRPLVTEHEELHETLVRATKVKGGIGEAAREVATLLHPHFVAEEEYALPPLGLLQSLAAGPVTPEMKDVLLMTDRLAADLPKMLAEHKAIVGALRKLVVAAKREKKPEWARFAEKLILHAQTEEQVLYPAAILVGERVKARS